MPNDSAPSSMQAFHAACANNQPACAEALVLAGCVVGLKVGLHPIVTFQYSSTTLYQVSYHIRYVFV